jgi:hypothetical protein
MRDITYLPNKMGGFVIPSFPATTMDDEMDTRWGHTELASKGGLESVLLGGAFVPIPDLRHLVHGQTGDPSSSDVLGASDRLKVIGVYARSSSTEVIEFFPFGDGTTNRLPVHDVRAPGLAGYGVMNESVPSTAFGQVPFPAGRGVTVINSRVAIGHSSVMAVDKHLRLATNPTVLTVSPSGDRRGISASTLTQTGGIGIMGEHRQVLSGGAIPPAVPPARGLFFPQSVPNV